MLSSLRAGAIYSLIILNKMLAVEVSLQVFIEESALNFIRDIGL